MDPSNHHFYTRIQNSGNYLLVKDDVGKAKPSVRMLPQEGFAYGKKIDPDAEGAGRLLSSWAVHQQSAQAPPDKDFKKLNALSIKQGATTSKMQRQFRTTTDARLQSANPTKPRDTVPNITFGDPTRPSTPIKAVVGHFYGNVAAEIKHAKYEPPQPVKKSTATKHTRGSEMMKNAIQQSGQTEVRPEFKLGRFKKVEKRTETRRVQPKEDTS